MQESTYPELLNCDSEKPSVSESFRCECDRCGTTESACWEKVNKSLDKLLCFNCYLHQKRYSSDGILLDQATQPQAAKRKRVPINDDSSYSLNFGKSASLPKGKGRRHIFKSRNPTRTSLTGATISTRSSVWHNDQFYRVNDVVALIDIDDHLLYYAQIYGIVIDEYAEKFASLRWLLPTTLAPADGSFEASTYILGPKDFHLRSFRYLQYVCSCPGKFFNYIPFGPKSIERCRTDLWMDGAITRYLSSGLK